ncbi:MAG TPA: sugar phosphate isomerase/epimerase family protein [Candidatus Acidoferrum sp.]|jgi:D-psicose/D-tagatose/L-ribulose 3-epimerase|nr:sugar phosphate isomerase/epimerase family protein [Candidatus Acidoferrum sp.]
MRFSINTVLFVSPFTNSNTGSFKNFKRWGYDAVEILLENPSDIDPGLVKEKLDAQELACGSICAAMNRERDLRGSIQSQRNSVKYLCRLLDIMVELDCLILGGPIYSYVGRADAVSRMDYRKQWKDVVRNLKIVAKYAQERGRIICVEPLNRFETDFLNTIDQGLKLIEDVGSPALKLHVDTFHMNIEEKKLGDAIRCAGKHLRHIHACGSDRGTPGNDHTDWRDMAAALKEINYQGDVVLETVTLDVPRIARSAAVWRRMEPTRDEIAINGLKFFKKCFA